jgi:hypothetical protein
MEMLLTYSNGSSVDALLLAAATHTMRVVLHGKSDTSELYEVDGQWFDDAGMAIEIGALTTDGDVDVNKIFTKFAQTTRLAAG